MIHIESNELTPRETEESKANKFKSKLFPWFESDVPGVQQEGGESGNESEKYSFPSKKLDELDRYLNLEFDKLKLTANSLDFWKEQEEKGPRLSRLARWIFSIPATSTSVERQFSGAGLVIQERRPNLNREQIDNILPIRSTKKYENWFGKWLSFFVY